MPRLAPIALVLTSPVLAQTFTGLGAPAGGSSDVSDLSADGTTLVGVDYALGPGFGAFRWTAQAGRTTLPPLPGYTSEFASGVSADGSVIVGTLRNSSTGYEYAVRWSALTPALVGTLPGGAWSYGIGVSRSGLIIVGGSDWDFAIGPLHAFRWIGGGMIDLGLHPNLGLVDFAARATSDDGSVVVGNANDLGGSNRGFRWTAATGMVDIGPANPMENSSADDVSADGTVIVGGTEQGPFRWTSSGLSPLPIPGGMLGGAARRITGDGSVCAGSVYDAISGYAVYWDAGGMHDLAAALGAALPAGWTLQGISGISDDGRTFAGTGTHYGVREAFVASIAPGGGCYVNCDSSTTPPMLNIQDFTCFLNRFASADTYANCDSSTTPPVLNIQDFTCFLNRFGVGCS